MRVLLAQIDGKWLQRVDGNSVLTSDSFKAHVAAQFAVAPALVTVVERDVADDAARQAIVAALAGGAFESLAVTAAPVIVASPGPREIAIAKIDAAVTDATVPQTVKAALVAIKATL